MILIVINGVVSQAMMLNEGIKSLDALQTILRKAVDYLSAIAPETPYSEFEHKLQEIGLERGWGNNAERVSEMIQDRKSVV